MTMAMTTSTILRTVRMSDMFLFDRALLDAESFCHCICLLQLQLLLLCI